MRRYLFYVVSDMPFTTDRTCNPDAVQSAALPVTAESIRGVLLLD